MLAQNCTNTTEITYIGGLQWATPPTTLGSLCLMLLAEQFTLEPAAIAPHVSHMLPDLVQAIQSSADHVRENALLLMLAYARVAQPEAKQWLGHLNVFNALCRYLPCSSVDMRVATAQVCCLLYEGNLELQMKFVQVNGGELLVQLISRSVEDAASLLILLKCLEVLLLDGEGRPEMDICAHLTTPVLWEIFKEIQRRHENEPAAEQAQRVLKILISSCHSMLDQLGQKQAS